MPPIADPVPQGGEAALRPLGPPRREPHRRKGGTDDTDVPAWRQGTRTAQSGTALPAPDQARYGAIAEHHGLFHLSLPGPSRYPTNAANCPVLMTVRLLSASNSCVFAWGTSGVQSA